MEAGGVNSFRFSGVPSCYGKICPLWYSYPGNMFDKPGGGGGALDPQELCNMVLVRCGG